MQCSIGNSPHLAAYTVMMFSVVSFPYLSAYQAAFSWEFPYSSACMSVFHADFLAHLSEHKTVFRLNISIHWKEISILRGM